MIRGRAYRAAAPNVRFGPLGDTDKVEELLVHRVDPLRVWAGASGNRFDALALPVPQQPERVDCERGVSLVVLQNVPDPVNEFGKAALALGGQLILHDQSR